jgi:hypothetical protein
MDNKITNWLLDYGVTQENSKEILKELDNIVEDYLTSKAAELMTFPITFNGLVAESSGSIINFKRAIDDTLICTMGKDVTGQIELAFSTEVFLKFSYGDMSQLQSLVKIAAKAYANR